MKLNIRFSLDFFVFFKTLCWELVLDCGCFWFETDKHTKGLESLVVIFLFYVCGYLTTSWPHGVTTQRYKDRITCLYIL